MIRGYAQAKTDDEARALPEALREVGAETVYVDVDGSRAERDCWLFDLRTSDVALLLAREHLGIGREIPRLEAIITEKGCELRIQTPDVPTPRKPGPAPMFAPEYGQEDRIRRYWHGPFRRADALDKAAEIMGHPVTANMLNKHLGPRSKPRPWINAKERP